MGVISQTNFRLYFLSEKTVEGVEGKFEPIFTRNRTQENGTGLDQQNEVWYDVGRTLAASASESLDLAGGLVNPFGEAITFTKIKGIYIYNNNLVAGDILRIGGAASNAFPLFAHTSDKIDCNPGQTIFIDDPSLAARAVTAGTGDLLKLEEVGGANTVTFDIAIWGVK